MLRGSLAIALVALLLGAGCGHAATADSRPPNAPEYAERTPPPSAENVVLDMPNPHDAVADPAAAIALINQHATMVEHELRDARGRGATQTAACIDDKLTQIHAQERMGEDQSKAVAEAHANSDATREHEARVMIGVARDRAAELAREADRCGGTVSNGRSEVDVQVDRSRAAMNPMPVVPAR